MTIIEQKTADIATNIALDTFALNKQILIFVNSKRSAESQAEKIAHSNTTYHHKVLDHIATQITEVLSAPTKQCIRLAKCVKKGSAFHHSGLAPKQRELIEDAFLKGYLRSICATPTLAAGVNLPAFRVLIRDLKRFGPHGMQNIAVLEYHQMAGRCGRPDFNDVYGECITLAKHEQEKEDIFDEFISAPPEQIISKLAVEPVLRTYILSLISTGFVKDWNGLIDFFSRTFYAHQYGDIHRLESILAKMLTLLYEWKFIEKIVFEEKKSDFISAYDASSLQKNISLKATLLGQRVSELYLDPFTAHHLIVHFEKAQEKYMQPFSILHLICQCLEMRPLLYPKQKEMDLILSVANSYEGMLLTKTPTLFDENYEDFLAAIKTADMLLSWCEEISEEQLLEVYNVTPGELHYKLSNADWILYASEELCRLLSLHSFRSLFSKLRIRLSYGVKEELLTLLKLKGVGRVRARKLYVNGIKDLGAIKDCDISILRQLVGKLADDLKKQVGINVTSLAVKENKRKGQISLVDFSE